MRTWVEQIDKPVCELSGKTLEREHIEERLIAYETTRAYESAQEGDFVSITYMIGGRLSRLLLHGR